MSDIKLWLWLTSTEGMNSVKATRLLERFGTVDEVYAAQDYTGVEGLTGDDVRALCDKSFVRVNKIIQDCKKFRIRILTYDNPHYPQLLAHIFDPPYVLYVKSRERIDLNGRLCIAMVGNRRMTVYGKEAAVELGRELARAGVVVVSGMAKGIDGAAQWGALEGGGLTVAVLGCGLDICYPPENYELMDEIVEHGMVLSEYPPGTRPLPGNFPHRNRIISGLCRGTLVVEAPRKSGSLITASLALEQGRDVFAVPGNMHQKQSAGTNNLIKSGAKLVDSAFDIIEEYRDEYLAQLADAAQQSLTAQQEQPDRQTQDGYASGVPEGEVSPVPNPQAPAKNEARPVQRMKVDNSRYEGLSAEEKAIVDNLSLTPTHIDELNRRCGLDTAKLNSLLTLLEMKGVIRSQPGKNFVLEI